MIKALISVLFLFFLTKPVLQSQTEYMPLGAKVFGNVNGSMFSGNFTRVSEKDTLCGGIPCRKIVETLQNVSTPYRSVSFSRQVKDSVFFWDAFSQKFNLSFRTHMSVGDSISYLNPFLTSSVDTIKLYADSVKIVNSMQITKCRLKCPRWWFTIEIIIYDRFGTPNPLIPNPFCLGFSDEPIYTPICYRDNQYFFTTSNFNGSSCSLTTAINERIEADISISPNPTQNYLDISSNENVVIRACFLINSVGQGIQKKAFNDVKTAHFALNDMPNGIYFMKIVTSSGHSIIKKVIINP